MSADTGPVAGPVVDQVIGRAPGGRIPYAPARFELSGSVLFLQPGAGNLEYGTLVTPFPCGDTQLEPISRSRLTSGRPSESGTLRFPSS